ncbi:MULTISPECIES: preprotein translocase subunit SecA [unclassified Nocardioides]|uniref:preprotein translocase subunit SecA n=1 Tax=unclassified Nocardioides TaxID=2615069 RepID=UPI0006F86A31|nr:MULTISPECIES: preprotein translocase subunit SecA [unclassified Nocardioides]KQY56256.1 preprotein translocase subunit SecA [Nocardioides sp. Root140]KQZ75040.1 preprotein translocase subunit SecA [Nocardioides sp. Root151]KRF10574.1 preprotein translocase subunit SecA [Nocardioides sp. Soil796]
MPAILDKILRIGEGKILRELEAVAKAVNAIEDDFVKMSDAELRAMTDEFKERLGKGETLDDIMPEAFATVREAAHRVIGQRHYDVQIMGGAALHMGNIAEMKTGEGKTLVATLPAYLNALAGQGVHIVTVNDYLAKFQSEMMGRIHHFLGLSTGVILPSMRPAERREAYNCDITYGTNNELGFDYLRDNMASDIKDCVQRGHGYAIVDEVDSILIDEARTPLIISGPTQDEVRWYAEFAKIARTMKIDVDYEVDEKKRTISVLEGGITKVEDHLGIVNLYDSVNTPLISFMNNSIKAKELFRKDKEYVVMDGEVLIVDEHTGRMLAGRRYNDGLHQAIEAKEGVTVREEYQTLATVTLQNYFRLYKKLSGMTGTAMTEASEFDKIYNLGVVPIPTNKPMLRNDQADLVYRTEEAKYLAVCDDIVERHKNGQPVLVGTVSVEKSELLSGLLKKKNIPHSVLNAKVHADEARIVAMAGHKGAVTVATNMAGRGTDIMLGGSVEFLADEELRKKGLEPTGETADQYEAEWEPTLVRIREQVKAEHDEVKDTGGLYVVGTERHESRRIDNQLRGRSGRQGDPGESRFYLSLQDELMRLFKSDWVDRVLTMLKVPDDVPIENKRVTGAIANAQGQIESQNFESRKNVLKYDDVMDRQRHVIYGERREVLEGADLEQQMRGFVDDVIEAYVTGATEGFAEEWDLDALWTALKQLYPISLSLAQVEEDAGARAAMSRVDLTATLQKDAQKAYDEREALVGEENMRELERRVVLSVLDRKWRDHLYEMDYLREGIYLRAYSQRDPLVEYQREGFDMFQAMMDGIKEESVGFLFNLEVEVEEDEAPAEVVEADEVTAVDAEPTHVHEGPRISAKGLQAPAPPANLSYTGPSEDGEAEVTGGTTVTDADDPFANVGRNADCPCGSGKKYKKCHGAPGGPTGLTTRVNG